MSLKVLATALTDHFPSLHQKKPVDVVVVWEGIDTEVASGRNLVTKMAILIQTVVANSAGCERLFSELGMVHTKKRCLLGLAKAEKSSRVRMMLKRQHLKEGLGPNPRKRRLIEDELDHSPSPGPQPPHHSVHSSAASRESAVTSNVVDFGLVSHQLIEQSEEDARDEEEDEQDQSQHSRQQNASNASSSRTDTPQRTRTRIRLEDLFRYPNSSPSETSTAPWSGWEKFWKGGLARFEEEGEILEILTEEVLEEPQGASDAD